VERTRLDKCTLEIELPEKHLEHCTHEVVTGGVASLSDGHAQGSEIQRHLGDERGSATTGGLNRTSQGLAITDQLIEIACPTWNLSNRPITDGGTDGSDIHLQEEVVR